MVREKISSAIKLPAGFTLVELVVVILIIGVLATIAAPSLFDNYNVARDNALRQTLTVIRNSISLYSSTYGTPPGADGSQATLKANLQAYIHSFPENPFGIDPSKLDWVKMEGGGVPLSTQIGGLHGWIYDYTTGEFRANTNAISHDGVTMYSEF